MTQVWLEWGFSRNLPSTPMSKVIFPGGSFSKVNVLLSFIALHPLQSYNSVGPPPPLCMKYNLARTKFLENTKAVPKNTNFIHRRKITALTILLSGIC